MSSNNRNERMQYRRFPGISEDISTLGFGCMRLPLTTEDPKDIDEQRAIEMVRTAIDGGVNYIDTAWPYHRGESEGFVAKALSDGYRDRVHLATKLPSWLIKERSDMDTYLARQLERLQTDHIDYYLIHALNKDFWENLTSLGLFDFLKAVKADGRVRHIGFSFHDTLDMFKTIVDAYPWDFCQIQYNFLDDDGHPGTEGLAYAYEKGVGVIVMEPLRGGALTANVPEEIQQIWDSYPAGPKTPAEWALRWVLDDPRVTTVLSGMSTMGQVLENLATMEHIRSKSLLSEELEVIARVRAIYKSRIQVPCTSCGYCMPCPSGVDIPGSFGSYNNAFIFQDPETYGDNYRRFNAGGLASKCVACGVCEPLCPQHIPIIEMLEKVTELFLTDPVK